MSKCVFTQADGMTGRVLLVMLMPMTMAAPHPHGPGTEEIWTKLTPGNALLLLGSELREHAAVQRLPRAAERHDVARTGEYVEDADGDVALRRRRQRATPAPPQRRRRSRWRRRRRGGPGAGNPNLSRDQAVVDQATVKGKPLK